MTHPITGIQFRQWSSSRSSAKFSNAYLWSRLAEAKDFVLVI